jgi:hypothetical protein
MRDSTPARKSYRLAGAAANQKRENVDATGAVTGSGDSHVAGT